MPLPLAWLAAKFGVSAVKNWRLILAGLAAIVICATIIAAKSSYDRLVADNAKLTANVAQLDTALKTEKAANDAAKAAIGRWKKAEEETRKRSEALSKSDEEARRAARRVDEFFATRDLLKQMLADPHAVSRDAVRTYRRLWRLFQCQTSASRSCTRKAAGAKRADTPAP